MDAHNSWIRNPSFTQPTQLSGFLFHTHPNPHLPQDPNTSTPKIVGSPDPRRHLRSFPSKILCLEKILARKLWNPKKPTSSTPWFNGNEHIHRMTTLWRSEDIIYHIYIYIYVLFSWILSKHLLIFGLLLISTTWVVAVPSHWSHLHWVLQKQPPTFDSN